MTTSPPAFGFHPDREPATAPIIDSRDPTSFAHSVLHERHPELIRKIRDTNPYGPAEHAALEALADEITRGTIAPLITAAPDGHAWKTSASEMIGELWDDVPFLWAESFFYRKLAEAVGYHSPGPYQHLDMFGALKTAELTDPTLDDHLAATSKLGDLTEPQRAEALLVAALWGNRADLGFHIGVQAGATQPASADTGIIHDDSAALLDHLAPGGNSNVHMIADNAGRELLADLLLIDHLLQHQRAATVALHLKPSPYYVSDATPTDLAACLRRLAAGPPHTAQAANRLYGHLRAGRLTVLTHWFYCAPLSFHHMPNDLTDALATATITILKGDLNYRRLTADRAWEPTTPFADVTAYFPSAVSAVRTLKSDVIVGLTASTLRQASETDARWRVNGTLGVIQLRS